LRVTCFWFDAGFPMTLSAFMPKLAVAAFFTAAIGIGVALSAPSPETSRPAVADAVFEPGMDGVDYAAITGPRKPADGNAVPACADPARRGTLRPC
jgi:hypothetical protein